MLLGNYSVFNKSPGRFFAGTTQCDRSDWNTSGSARNFYYTDGGDFNTVGGYINTHSSFFYGTPLGAVPPYSWVLTPKAGGMAMRSTGSGTMTQNLIPQYLMISAMTGSGDLAATIFGYGNLICALTGSSSFTAGITATGNIVLSMTGEGTLTLDITGNGVIVVDMTGSSSFTAAASLFINMIAAMTGSGTLSADASLLVGMVCAMSGGGTMTMDIIGQKEMSVSLTGTGDLAADINAFAEMVLDLVGSGTLNAGTGAIAYMSIDMVVTGTGLTTSNVGNAVWASVANVNNSPGTMGEKLNDAGSASNPWTEIIEGTYTAAEVLRLLSSVAAGKSTIVDNGGGNATVIFRDLEDTLNRVDATMDNSERINVTLNL